MSDDKKDIYRGFAKETTQGTPVNSDLMERHIKFLEESGLLIPGKDYPKQNPDGSWTHVFRPYDPEKELERLRAENEHLDIELFDWDMRLRALEAENAALREIVKAVANAESYHVTMYPESRWVLLLDNPTLSYAQELLTKARALLGA